MIGINITLHALGGTIGSEPNFLETDLLDGGTLGVLSADAAGSIFINENAGDLRINTVVESAERERGYAAPELTAIEDYDRGVPFNIAGGKEDNPIDYNSDVRRGRPSSS